MSEPDEAMVEAVARAINAADNEWADAPRTTPHEVWPTHVARAALSVPVVRDALARDAQVREAAADAVWMAKLARGSSWPGEMAQAVDNAAERVIRALGTDGDRAALDAVTAALYPSPGDRDDSEEQR